jgi:hypothetical protein
MVIAHEELLEVAQGDHIADLIAWTLGHMRSLLKTVWPAAGIIGAVHLSTAKSYEGGLDPWEVVEAE